MFRKGNQHTDMQISNALNANEACPWMLIMKCLLAMLILMLVILMLILMLLNLNTGYADIDADLCIRIMSLCCTCRTFSCKTRTIHGMIFALTGPLNWVDQILCDTGTDGSKLIEEYQLNYWYFVVSCRRSNRNAYISKFDLVTL